MTTCSGVQFQLGLKRRRVQCTALGRRPKNRAKGSDHTTVIHKNEKCNGLGVRCPACPGWPGWGFFPGLVSLVLFSFLRVSVCFFLSPSVSFHWLRATRSSSGWEGRRVKRTGTDPRTGGGADPRTGFFRCPSTYAFLLSLDTPVLFFVFLFATLFLRITTGVTMGIAKHSGYS